jgi:hypothetical protein
VDRCRTDDDALPAFFRRAQAKEPDNVNHVGMKFEVGSGLVSRPSMGYLHANHKRTRRHMHRSINAGTLIQN